MKICSSSSGAKVAKWLTGFSITVRLHSTCSALGEGGLDGKVTQAVIERLDNPAARSDEDMVRV